MSANWKASRELVRFAPDEWQLILRGGHKVGIIRRQVYGRETWFRAVTWASEPRDRQLVGYAQTLDAAATALWVHRLRTKRK